MTYLTLLLASALAQAAPTPRAHRQIGHDISIVNVRAYLERPIAPGVMRPLLDRRVADEVMMAFTHQLDPNEARAPLAADLFVQIKGGPDDGKLIPNGATHVFNADLWFNLKPHSEWVGPITIALTAVFEGGAPETLAITSLAGVEQLPDLRSNAARLSTEFRLQRDRCQKELED